MADAKSNHRGFTIRALGEVAIRCGDVPRMMAFYRDILGLPVLAGDDSSDIVFFDLGDGYGGHRSVLALFRHDAGRADLHARASHPPTTGSGSSLHHVALTVDASEQDAVMRWYESNSIPYRVQVFDWIGWRGVFAQDPEGNTVELVAYDRAFSAQDDRVGG